MASNNGNILKIREAIMEVIAFFDLFSCPMSEFEIWNFLGVQTSFKKFGESLAKIDKIEKKNGFYFLRGREEIVGLRRKRYNFAYRKFKRALWVARLFKFIPWIRMIAVGNMMGGNNLKDKSDIDFFIITEKKRIWITRFFCVGLVKLFGMRPTEANKRDKICLSFYLSEDALDMRGLMLGDKKNREEKAGINILQSAIRNPQFINDPYFFYWLACLVPIYDRDGAYQQLIKNNTWLYGAMPNWRPLEMVERRSAGQGFNGLYHDIVDLFIGGLESTVKKWQLKIMPKGLKSAMNQGTNVVVSDSVLKLYAIDRREEYRGKFLKKLRELNI